jgi:alanine-glyoxylate transaminase/serine-glyoxylate transaminase/serine-pyruvate transaminase
VPPRVMQAMGAPVISHLDPAMMSLLDDLRERLSSAFGAGDGALSLAISGTGTAGMEAAVANLTKPGARALVVVTGYFGDRLAQMLERYGATVSRLQVEWGRACDPAQVERALSAEPADIVAVVHGETSTGVVNPIDEILAIARKQGALTIVDAVTTLGGVPLMAGTWGADACYSCTQKGLGAPVGAGLGPLAGKIWRVGLMGAGSSLSNIVLFLSAFERVLRACGHRSGSESAALAAAERVVAAV